MKICELKLGAEKIDYKIKNNSLAKKLTLSIKSDGQIILTKPGYVSYKDAQNFVNSQISWIYKNYNRLKLSNDTFNTAMPDSGTEYKRLKNSAVLLFTERLGKINSYYNFHYKKVSVRNQKTRWGSCSRKKTLSFNYKLIKLPLKYVDYVITHELCHLKEFNHSKNFWKLVEDTIPEYKKIRRELKAYEI